MQIQVEIIAVEVVNKGKYKVAEVTYKQEGKTNTKKVMSFGAQEHAFKFISSDKVKKGDVYNVEINKNADGYWDWVKISFAEASGAAPADASSAAKGNPRQSNYETPQERFQRQVYIIRQSSLGHAVEALNHNKKNYDTAEILTLANQFEEWVFGKSNPKSQYEQQSEEALKELGNDIPM